MAQAATSELTIGLLMAGSYLLGSIPFGLWLVKRWKGIDIRTVGSGNIGSTNVGRVTGPLGYVIVFIFDLLKGLLPPLLAARLGLASQWQILAALCGIIGHNYSLFLSFKGGKGIAASAGALFGVSPLVGLGVACIFITEMLTLRWVSFGSMLGAMALPFLTLWLYPGDYYRLGFAILAGGMALYKHRSNLQRLRAGSEPKVHFPWNKKRIDIQLESALEENIQQDSNRKG